MELTKEQKQNIQQQKLLGYQRSLYSLQIDFEIAEILEQTSATEQIKKDMANTMKAVKHLEGLLGGS